MLHEALCTPSYPPPHLLHRTPDTAEFSRVPSSELASSLLSTQLSRHFYLPTSRCDCESDLRRFILCLAEHQRADELAFLRQHARRVQIQRTSAYAPKLTQVCPRTKPPHPREYIEGDPHRWDATKTRAKTTPVFPKTAPGLATSPAPAPIAQSLEDAEAEFAAAARGRILFAYQLPSVHDLQIKRPVLPNLSRSLKYHADLMSSRAN